MKNEQCWYKEVCENECDNCIRYLEMKYLFDNSNIPRNKQFATKLKPVDADYDSFCELANIRNNIVEFVDSGSNLYIMSTETGNGKTSWAIKLMLKYFSEIWAGNGFRVRGLFIHTPSLLTQLKDFSNPLNAEYRETIKNCDLVIWDDIASTSMSGYDLAQLLVYIDARILAGKANIFTGNIVTESQMQKVLGTRLTSRIFNGSKQIEFFAKDSRNSLN